MCAIIKLWIGKNPFVEAVHYHKKRRYVMNAVFVIKKAFSSGCASITLFEDGSILYEDSFERRVKGGCSEKAFALFCIDTIDCEVCDKIYSILSGGKKVPASA
ncbi:MAG: hypothetical protein K5837_02900 [Candidatus Saccharibacteria bacterium]|nr:hypothetical protein [Candidatus Saccharibacteria bacterium]